MTRIFSYTQAIEADIVDAFCLLQKGFTDQFVYYRKEAPVRFMGLGRCVALPTLDDAEITLEGPAAIQPTFFSFNRFDAENPAPADELFSSFPRLKFMLPEVVLIENERGAFLQVNSLGPVYPGRVARFTRDCERAPERTAVTIPYRLEPDSRDQWQEAMAAAGDALAEERVRKVVLSRRKKLVAEHPFSCCTPELLVRKQGCAVESMCLAGTCPTGASKAESEQLATELMADGKNREEHQFVVDFIRSVFERVCYNVEIPSTPTILRLAHVQHLFTPAKAQVLEGVSLMQLAEDLHPTPATAGAPVGEATMLIRQIEPYNRGFYAGACGYVDGAGDGEFSVALRTGVFDGETGYVYAGCGIVEESDAQSEFEEIDLKLRTILSAFGG